MFQLKLIVLHLPEKKLSTLVIAGIFRIRILVIGIAFLSQINIAVGQESLQDSPSVLDPSSAAMRSGIIPGWGQIYQERLVTGLFYYSSSIYFYYQGYKNYHRYNTKNKSSYRKKAMQNIGIGIFFHLTSIGDALYIGYKKQPTGWQGSLHGDKPLKSPWGATLRSAIIPGWGQFYNRSYIKGIFYLALDSYIFYKIREADNQLEDTGIPKYRGQRSRYSWYFGLAYLFTLMDAHVGAYLYKFDKAMLLAVSPTIIDHVPGISLHVSF